MCLYMLISKWININGVVSRIFLYMQFPTYIQLVPKTSVSLLLKLKAHCLIKNTFIGDFSSQAAVHKR